jgi:hypothetical protein
MQQVLDRASKIRQGKKGHFKKAQKPSEGKEINFKIINEG